MDTTKAAGSLALEACRQIVWKLSHNWDDGKPARIDRRDAVIRMAVRAIEVADAPAPTNLAELQALREIQ